jgi:hypothetical protein
MVLEDDYSSFRSSLLASEEAVRIYSIKMGASSLRTCFRTLVLVKNNISKRARAVLENCALFVCKGDFMSEDTRVVGDSPDTPLPPSTPIPPIPPGPVPIPFDTIWDMAKIVIFVVVWYATSDANHALTAAVDYAKLPGPTSTLTGVSWMGAKIGILQGLIMAVQALAIIWASPTLFIYLGPVLSSAFRTPIRLVAEFRRALSSKSTDSSDQDGDGNGQKKS